MAFNMPSSGWKKLLAIIILLGAGFVVSSLALPINNYLGKSEVVNNIRNSSIVGKIQDIEKQISAPPPLRNTSNAGGELTRLGAIAQTNIQRKQNGNLPALTENSKLDLAAEAKLKDMFIQQYFEHISPQGKGPSDLAKAAGYEYISIGENLALGNFKNDKDLVEAWMNRPGHRANILNNKYLEIGVAVGQGMYEGKQTWLAVQEFGKPLSSCPAVDENLKAQILSAKADVSQIEPQLAALKNEMDSSNPKTKPEYDAYNEKVGQYNALVKIYNNKVDTLKAATEQYNKQVRDHNACAGN